jgi:hypothetical protein
MRYITYCGIIKSMIIWLENLLNGYITQIGTKLSNKSSEANSGLTCSMILHYYKPYVTLGQIMIDRGSQKVESFLLTFWSAYTTRKYFICASKLILPNGAPRRHAPPLHWIDQQHSRLAIDTYILQFKIVTNEELLWILPWLLFHHLQPGYM